MSLSSSQPSLKSSAAPRPRRPATARTLKAAPAAFPVPRKQNRLTVEGTLFIMLTLILGLAAVHSGHNLLYLVFSVMLAMLLLSGSIARANLSELHCERHYPLEFHAGQEISGTIELHNNKRRFSSYGVRVQDYFFPPPVAGKTAKPAQVVTFGAIVRARQSINCPVTINVDRRGLYKLVSLQIVSSHPFGFFQRARRYDVGGQVLVYPRLVSAQVLKRSFSAAAGEIETDRKGHGLGLFGVRDYAPGDPARMIHWKHSAKGMGLKLKEFEEERAQSYRIMLDLRCGEDPPLEVIEDFEKALSVAASFAHYLLTRQIAVGLWTTQGSVPVAAGRVQIQRIMRALAAVVPQAIDAPAPPIDMENANISTLWIQFQDETNMRGRSRIARPFATSIIDARKLALEEEKPAATS